MDDIINKMIEEAFSKSHFEEDDVKRASIYRKCLSAIKKLIKHETNTKQG